MQASDMMSVDATVQPAFAAPPTCLGCGTYLQQVACKQGANAGRSFWSCTRSQKGVANACSAWHGWVDEPPKTFDPAAPKCKTCQTPMQMGTVGKDGPNKGKKYWSCSNKCAGSFVGIDKFDKPPAAKEADLQALAARVGTLENSLFLLSQKVAVLEARK